MSLRKALWDVWKRYRVERVVGARNAGWGY